MFMNVNSFPFETLNFIFQTFVYENCHDEDYCIFLSILRRLKRPESMNQKIVIHGNFLTKWILGIVKEFFSSTVTIFKILDSQ